MPAARCVKLATIASLSLFALLTAANNVLDYDTNAQFVRHTLSMDATFRGNRLQGRAIADPNVWTAAYCALVVAEALVAATLGIGASG